MTRSGRVGAGDYGGLTVIMRLWLTSDYFLCMTYWQMWLSTDLQTPNKAAADECVSLVLDSDTHKQNDWFVTNVGSMLGKRLRLWPGIEPAFAVCVSPENDIISWAVWCWAPAPILPVIACSISRILIAYPLPPKLTIDGWPCQITSH